MVSLVSLRAWTIALVATGCYHAQDTSRGDADADAAGPHDAPAGDASTIDAPTPNLSWSWTFGGAAACPSGVDRVQLYTAQWDTDGVDYRGEPSAPATFPCSAGAGGVAVAEGFDYDAWIAVLTTDDRVFAVTGPMHVDVGATATTDVALPRGWVHVGWSLFGEQSQQPLACSDVASLTGSGHGAVQLVPGAVVQTAAADAAACASGDTWLALPAGTYDLTLRAVYSQAYLPANGPDAYTLGATTFASQSVAADATLDLGVQQLPLTQY